MLIEIHMIQNHSPSNLNRDDLGAPKTCIFGGVTRARISSQCLKRSIRRSAQFQELLEKDGGVQTRSLIREVARQASSNGEPDEEIVNKLEKIFRDGGVPIEAKKGDNTASKIIWVLPRSAIKAMADATVQRNGNLGAKIADILGKSAIVPDIALAGRMTEFDAKGPFEDLGRRLRVEAALQASHAISTHGVVNEVDYFTAAEDLQYTQGAAHPDEAMFNSACFYKYFCLDWDQLVKNLGGNEDARRLAACTLGHFIRAAALTTPSGKQNSFAANNGPCGILVEVKKNGKHPTSYANAFADPVERIGKWDDDGPDYVSLEGRSIARFGDHVFNLRKAYGIESTLLWHAMPMYRFPLQGWEREDDGRRKRDNKGNVLPPVAFTKWNSKQSEEADSKDRSCARIDGDNKEGLVEAVIESIEVKIKDENGGERGLTWDNVKDVGKSHPEGTAS